MNIVITIQKKLVEKIISGEKKFEMRKYKPWLMMTGVDGFFVVEKGTSKVRCWCRVDEIQVPYIDSKSVGWFAGRLCVSEDYINRYADGRKVYLWKIGKVVEFSNIDRTSLGIDTNPQQFAYCPGSYGESFWKEGFQ